MYVHTGYNDNICLYFSVHIIYIFVTRSDKRVTVLIQCQFGRSELLIPAESATMELSFDISFKTV